MDIKDLPNATAGCSRDVILLAFSACTVRCCGHPQGKLAQGLAILVPRATHMWHDRRCSTTTPPRPLLAGCRFICSRINFVFLSICPLVHCDQTAPALLLLGFLSIVIVMVSSILIHSSLSIYRHCNHHCFTHPAPFTRFISLRYVALRCLFHLSRLTLPSI